MFENLMGRPGDWKLELYDTVKSKTLSIGEFKDILLVIYSHLQIL